MACSLRDGTTPYTDIHKLPRTDEQAPDNVEQGKGNTNGDWISYLIAWGLSRLPTGVVDVGVWSLLLARGGKTTETPHYKLTNQYAVSQNSHERYLPSLLERYSKL
jgi:hypothetical protein